MINYWTVPRPKRRLDVVPDVLMSFALLTRDEQWAGDRAKHVVFEEALEYSGVKQPGERTDMQGSGGRTYASWLQCLGLIYTEKATGRLRLTEAGEAMVKGISPREILQRQVLRCQYPSWYSHGIRLNPRFHIRPFRFLLRLLADSSIQYLSQDEIAKIVTTEAEREDEAHYKGIVSRILEYRAIGNKCISEHFALDYPSKNGVQSLDKTIVRLRTTANVLTNWLEYTELVIRDKGRLVVAPGMHKNISSVLKQPESFIENPEDPDYFQQTYGKWLY